MNNYVLLLGVTSELLFLSMIKYCGGVTICIGGVYMYRWLWYQLMSEDDEGKM